MAIAFQHETLLTLPQAAKLLPRRRAGRKPHVSTLYRWCSRGVKGIVLETIQIGGTTCTSVEALQRFFDLLQRIERPVKKGKPSKDAAKQAEHYLYQSNFDPNGGTVK